MIDLALHAGGEPVQCRDIAARQEIPEPYLNQLLGAMRRARLIVSRRGPGGGHQLARPAEEITLGAIVDALDGPVAPDWGADGQRQTSSCAGALHDVWRQVGATARDVVDGMTLAVLADQARERAHSYRI